jgi:hypothetical protein
MSLGLIFSCSGIILTPLLLSGTLAPLVSKNFIGSIVFANNQSLHNQLFTVFFTLLQKE